MGAIPWIDDQATFERLVDQLAAAPVYALDTEFHRERTYWPQLGLVQLAGPAGAALVDPQAVDLTRLADLFEAGGAAVAHAASQDLEVLEQACGALPGALFDTQLAAGFAGFSSPSLTSLVAAVLDVELAKGDRLTDWTRRPLSDSQKAYAAADVTHLLDLHAALRLRLAASGRLAWAEQECAALLARPRPAQEPGTAWWRIKESRTMRGQSRGVAQAVAAWRERRAAEVDRPPRTVLSDLAILGIAHQMPRTEQALRQVRGIDGRPLGGPATAAILAAVEA
ncbi:MAG: ribonuclease D, partial [Acidimicrobiales bacterium]